MTEYNLKEMLNTIIPEDKQITINIKDLIWAILIYQHKLHQSEQKLYDALDGRIYARIHDLKIEKECYASRSDEIATIISKYSDFDTQKIWKETRQIHKLTETYGR